MGRVLQLFFCGRQRGERAADGLAITDHIPAGKQAGLAKGRGDGATDNGHDLNSGHKYLQSLWRSPYGVQACRKNHLAR